MNSTVTPQERAALYAASDTIQAAVGWTFAPTRAERLEAHQQSAWKDLRDEMIDALAIDATLPVQCPGFKPTVQPAVDIVADLCDGVNGSQFLPELLRIAAGCANRKHPGLLMMQASALFANIAREHADFHRADLETQRAENFDDADEGQTP